MHGNLEIAIKTQPWHHCRKSNTPLESSFSIDIGICRLLKPRLKNWSLGWPSCQWSHLAWNANALEHPIRIGLSWFEASKVWNDAKLSVVQSHFILGKYWKIKFSSNSCIPHGKSYFRRQEINFSSESPNPRSLDQFDMRQDFWERNEEKKRITLKLGSWVDIQTTSKKRMDAKISILIVPGCFFLIWWSWVCQLCCSEKK